MENALKERSMQSKGSFFKKLLGFIGPGYLVAVGYMDPGNWATSIAAGSGYGYTLLFIILLSNLMAILLQILAAKLGIVTGKDLAQMCRDHFHKRVAFMLWLLSEIAIVACDLAEVIGSAIALNLLFHLPLIVGVVITAFDILLILMLQNKGFRYIEAIVIGLIVMIAVCFGVEMILSKPEIKAVAGGFIPTVSLLKNPNMLYISLGIIGATVMPHNLYLHSSIVKTRKIEDTPIAKKQAIQFATIDSTVALTVALFVNAAILILAASAFHQTGHKGVTEIQDAYHLLDPILGSGIAAVIFGFALLASGQNSTLTGTLAGQIVMEGFLDLNIKPWIQRLVTRLTAIVPAVIVTMIFGEKGTGELLILSQVILSLQLPFAVIPLVYFTGNKEKMGEFMNKKWTNVFAWLVAGVIVLLNVYLLWTTFR